MTWMLWTMTKKAAEPAEEEEEKQKPGMPEVKPAASRSQPRASVPWTTWDTSRRPVGKPTEEVADQKALSLPQQAAFVLPHWRARAGLPLLLPMPKGDPVPEELPLAAAASSGTAVEKRRRPQDPEERHPKW